MDRENVVFPLIRGMWLREKGEPIPSFSSQLMVYFGFFLIVCTIPINHTNTIESAGVILALVGIIGCRAVRNDWKINSNPLNVPILFVIAVILLSLLSAYNLSYTLNQLWSEFLTYTVLFYAVADFCRERKIIYRFLFLFFLANLLALCLFFYQLYLNDFSLACFQLSLADKKYFSKGLPAESTYFLFISSFYYTALYYLKQKRFFLLAGTLLAINLYLLYLSYQRAGILAMGVVVIVPLFFWRQIVAKRISIVVSLTLILLVLLVIVTPIKSKFIYRNWSETISGQFVDNPDRNDSIQLRLGAQRFFLQYFRHHLFTGVGYGKSNLRKIDESSSRPCPGGAIHAHNVFFDFALQTGVQGLAAFLLLVFAQFRVAVQGLKQSTELFDRFVFTGALCYMSGFWVRMQFDDVYRSGTALAYWMIMAITVSLSLIVRSGQKIDKGPCPPSSLTV